MAERSDLLRLKRLLWTSIREADPEKRAPLAKEYRTVSARIDELANAKTKSEQPKGGGGDDLDELTARRAAREGRTASSEGHPSTGSR
ncbi:MAG: hypothetical protein ACTII7_07735 [Galactobacter sp.]